MTQNKYVPNPLLNPISEEDKADLIKSLLSSIADGYKPISEIERSIEAHEALQRLGMSSTSDEHYQICLAVRDQWQAREKEEHAFLLSVMNPELQTVGSTEIEKIERRGEGYEVTLKDTRTIHMSKEGYQANLAHAREKAARWGMTVK